jgi:hypothetical protein
LKAILILDAKTSQLREGLTRANVLIKSLVKGITTKRVNSFIFH